MRFLGLVFAVLLLVSMAASGYGQVLKYCPKVGYCSSKCSKSETWARSHECKMYCCLPANKKWN